MDPPPPPGVSETFWRLLIDEQLAGKSVVDVGTGAGRMALALAPVAGRVVGIDRERDLIADARQRASSLGLRNVQFVVADADALGDFVHPGDDIEIHPDVVVAHLFLSDPLIANAATSLRPDGVIALLGFHVDQWKETGRPSRFAYDEARTRRLLEESGFVVEHLSVERHVREFGSLEEALAAAVGLQERWRADGRWFRYIRFLEEGGRTLTQSHLIAKARLGRRS